MAATATAPGDPTTRLGKAATEIDDRLIVAGPLRRTLNKVFPDHWSFLLGEIALYSFVILLLSGTYLTFYYDAATMLIRLRPEQQLSDEPREGQADFSYGDYVAYSKICTHAGCPVSLYEQETSRILCPCHQSQFDVTQGAKPVFGPATRPLPQLPITVDDEGYFVARSDYIEAVGPTYWNRERI